MKKIRTYLYIFVLAAVVFAAWYVSRSCFQLLLIHGESMSPTYRSGALVVLEKHPEEYRRGDVVLYHCDSLGQDIVKRIAAVPGDTLQISGDIIRVNSVVCAPLPKDNAELSDCLKGTDYIIPDGEYFLLGDNFSESIDSRDARVGLADESGFKGRVLRPRQ